MPQPRHGQHVRFWMRYHFLRIPRVSDWLDVGLGPFTRRPPGQLTAAHPPNT